jgi:hypothetical protein
MPSDKAPTAARDLVLGFAVGYAPAQVCPCIESLFGPGRFAGEVVLFVKPGDRALKSYLRSWGVRCIDFHPEAYPVPHIFLARWFAYRDFFGASGAEAPRAYRNILITDIRDVTFQKPLFARSASELEVHYEAPSPTIGACPINSAWIAACFGPEEVERLAAKRIVCAGTICGRMAGIRAYLDAMTRIAETLPPEAVQSGADQGVHNYIVHHRLIGGIVARDNFERVATLHYVDGASLGVDEKGRVVNPDGSISEIAHQWDRHPHLAAAIAHAAARRRRRSALWPARWLRLRHNRKHALAGRR